MAQDFMLDRRLVYFAACGLARLEQAKNSRGALGKLEGKQNSEASLLLLLLLRSKHPPLAMLRIWTLPSKGLSVSGPHAQ